MKKKTVFVVLSVGLLLLLTSIGYGGAGNRPMDVAHGWQDREDDSPLDVDLSSGNDPGNVTTFLWVRLGEINLFFIRHKVESPSDENSKTVSKKNERRTRTSR